MTEEPRRPYAEFRANLPSEQPDPTWWPPRWWYVEDKYNARRMVPPTERARQEWLECKRGWAEWRRLLTTSPVLALLELLNVLFWLSYILGLVGVLAYALVMKLH